jgi:roadblock/LC7 domain-containing protein
MSKSVDDLLKIDGVAAAGEFTLDGKLVAFKANVDFPKELAEATAQFTSAVTQLFNVLAGSYTKLSPFKFVPQQGWAYSGGEWSVAVGGNRGVFVRTAKADFNKLFEALVEPR